MRKVICIVGIIALLSAIIVVTPAAATTLDVYPGQSIQSAINSASDGDIILVHAGTYYEGAIRILGAAKRNITLKGEGADKVTLDGGGSSDNIGIGGDSMENGASGCVVEGFKMINSGKGIEIASFAPDCIIRNCVIEAPSMMIILHARNITFMNNVISNSTYSSRALSIPRNGSTIVNNTIINSVGAAILPYYDAPGPNGIISRNNFISNGKGIWLHSSYTYPGNKIYLNNFVNNTINVQYTGTPPLTYWNSTEPIDYTYGSNTYTNYLGNYWSPQYTGSDGDGDGIGDAPYDIPPASPVHYDYRPLMEKFENYVGAPAAAEPPHLATYTISNRTITPPQTTEIDVEFSETVSYKIAIEKGTATIYDWTGTAKNPAPKIWNGTYEANGTVVPDGDYRVNITGTNTTTGLSVVNNTEVITVMTITHKPDLIPTAVWDNQGKGGFLFANETNDITARINNTGSGDAGAFNVTLDIDSYTEIKTVSSLAAGANINVTFTGYAPTTPGSKTVNVTADKENDVAESNEANNLLSTSRQVYNNGYKGKRWTGGADIATVETYSLKGNVSYSTGNSAYTSANWKNISASWSSANLTIPSAATVLSAKLYVYYNFDATGGALWGDNTTFNSVSYPKAGASHYSDVKGWGLYSDRTYGALVYNVTSNFNKAGNTASLGDGISNRSVAIDGMILQVVYSDSSEPLRKIWINEGFDLLMADITKGTDTNETIAYAPFTGTIEPANISSARLIAIAPGAGDSTGSKSNVLFNSHSHWDALPPYKGATQLGIADINVLSELGASNTAAIQDNGDSGGMRASTTILAVEYKPAPTPTPKPANASVSLGASIRAAIAIEVTPSSINYGELAPGQTSSGNNLTVKNKGGYSINVSAEVTDSAENLFVDGVLLNDKLWNLYSAVIPKNGDDKPVAKLHVPDDYAGVGGMEGTMMFWAKKA